MSDATARISMLVQIAAVHVLLASHPEVAALPLRWAFDASGVRVRPDESRDPAAPEYADRLAAALGVKVKIGPDFGSKGERLRPYDVTGMVAAGVPVDFTAYLAVGAGGAE
jgi:hypothetical protein